MLLEKELVHFERIKGELLKTYKDKFALIRGEEFIGAYDSPSNAYEEGVKRFGKELFLVKRISDEEEI